MSRLTLPLSPVSNSHRMRSMRVTTVRNLLRSSRAELISDYETFRVPPSMSERTIRVQDERGGVTAVTDARAPAALQRRTCWQTFNTDLSGENVEYAFRITASARSVNYKQLRCCLISKIIDILK